MVVLDDDLLIKFTPRIIRYTLGLTKEVHDKST